MSQGDVAEQDEFDAPPGDLLDWVAEGVAVFGADGRVLHANAAARVIGERLGLDEARLPDADRIRRLDGARVGRHDLPAERTRRSGESVTNETLGIQTPEGTIRWLRISTRPIPASGPPYRAVSTFNDVTDELAAARPHHADDRFAAAFSSAMVGMAFTELDGGWLDVNDALADLLGYTKDELLVHTLHDLTHPEDRDVHRDFVAACLAGRQAGFHMTKRYIHATGRVIWACVSTSLVRDHVGSPAYFFSHIQDITAQRNLEERLRHLADHDPLTDLANRRRFDAELEWQIERSKRHGEDAALVLVDLDGFKRVNDTQGHTAGDELLIRIAQGLRARARASDVLARLGGDEFGALLIGVNVNSAQAVAQAFIDEVHHLGTYTAHDAPVTASAGVTAVTGEHNLRTVFRTADQALYRAKRRGRGRVVTEGANAN